MGRNLRFLVCVLFALCVAVALLLAPVKATYINAVGSDTIEYRTASCGPALTALLGAQPSLEGGSTYPMGGDNASASCRAGAGRRTSLALVLLLVFGAVGWTRDRRNGHGQPDASAVAARDRLAGHRGGIVRRTGNQVMAISV